MEDSMEHYIRIYNNTKNDPDNSDSGIKKAAATEQRKKEYEAYAMKIVMFLLDGKLRSEIFLRCLKYINGDYYQDVVEERAISKLCGYPLCGKKIPEMPKKKYHISTKANKVYDISERKNYCSNFCYKASLYIKDQIDSSPLWLRNHREMADCKLLSPTAVGTPGEEIDHGIVRVNDSLPQFTSVTHFTQISLEEIGDMEENSGKLRKTSKKYKVNQSQLNVIQENNSENDESESEKYDLECDNTIDSKLFNSNNDPNAKSCEKGKQDKKPSDETLKLQYLISKLKVTNNNKTKLIDPLPANIKLTQKLQSVQLHDNIKITEKKSSEVSGLSSANCELLAKIKTCVQEWITLDTFIYIYGEDKVKQDLTEKKMEEYFDKLKIKDLDMSYQLKYMGICRKLHMQALAEEKFDTAVLGSSLKPLPDFKQLKEEVQDLDFKVKCFYKGALYEKPDSNFPTKPIKENAEVGEGPVVLPLVDVSAQNVLRRKVFLSSINKSMTKFINELHLDESTVLSDSHDLVKSFKLQSHNVVFKPLVWPLVAYILIRILAIKQQDIGDQLEKASSVEHCKLIFSKYTGFEETVDEILTLLKNVDKFVENYITQQ